MLWWWGDGRLGAAGWVGFIFMIIVWVLIVAGIVFLIRSLVRGPSGHRSGYWEPPQHWHGGPGPQAGASDALRMLEERYARGEIGREEFLQKKADITGQGGSSAG
jgi:putative membrane protein